MLMIDADAWSDKLDDRRLVAAFREGHRRGVEDVGRLLLAEARARANHLLVWAAWQHGDMLGAKLVTVFPDNAPPVPSIASLFVLFDGANGTPLAVITGPTFTRRKTAADSALGASYLAREDAVSLLMIGAGHQAPHQVAALCAVRPSIRRVAVWNRTPEKAQRLAAALAIAGVEVASVGDLPEAVAAADIVCCATAATAPVLVGAWLAPGTHVDLVGSFTNAMREADDETIRRARVFVDTRRFTIGECGDITGPIAAGVIAADAIEADLFDLCNGRHPGRTSRHEITVFKNAGGGHLDLMMARVLYDLAAAP